jgi:Zn finger protein HypA/HybF involved in hydrogenase expression
MHERAAVTVGLRAVLAESGGSVGTVVADIGPGVDRDVVVAIWDELMAASGAELVIEESSDVLRCIVCGTDYAGTKLDRCVACGGDGLVIQAAPEFVVRSWSGGG